MLMIFFKQQEINVYKQKPSATKTEAADRINLLHGSIYRFEQFKSWKAGQLLVSLPRDPPFNDSHQKDKLNIG